MTQHTPTKDDAPPMDEKKPRPSMLDMAKKMDAAVRDADAKRATVDAAKTALDAATREYGEAVNVVNGLHQQYEALMTDILSFGGTVHVAPTHQ